MYSRNDVTQLFIVDRNNNLYATNASMSLELLQKEKWFNEFIENEKQKKFIATHDKTKYNPLSY